MKYLKYFLLVSILFLSLAFSTTRTSRLSESIYPGNLFPDIVNLENVSGTKMNLSDLKGQKVLVVFWAAYDANSRKDNVLLSNIIKKNNYPVKMVSVSFDKSKSIYNKTVMLDQVDNKFQFLASDESYDKMFSIYQLEKGFKNFLIDEDGMTLAMDVDAETLSTLLNEI